MSSVLERTIDSTPTALTTPGTRLVDWQTDTLVDLLQRRATEAPDQVLYTFLEDGESRELHLTAGELYTGARRIAQSLARISPPGERVVLLCADGVDFIIGLFACFTAGLVAVSGVHPAAPRSVERLLGIVRDCRATTVLGHAPVLAEFQLALDAEEDAADLRWLPIDLRAPTKAAAAWSARPGCNADTALLQYTSGSSRAPRGVMLSHRNVLHNLHGQMLAFGYQPGDTGVSWLPFSHDMGLIGCVLMAVFGGGRCVLLAPAHFLEDPSRWLRMISRYRATLSGGPNFAYDLCVQRADSMPWNDLDLRSWAVAVNGAEPIRMDVLRRFARTFARAGFDERALRPSYGLAEATLMVTCGSRLAPYSTLRVERTALQAHAVVPLAEADTTGQAIELVGCGSTMSGQQLAIVVPGSRASLGEGSIGEIWIAGPSVAAGYFGRPEDNLEYFGADLGDGRGPYLKTGDLGFISGGELYVTGRARDLIILRGKNYYPQDLEFSADSSHAAIRAGGSACFLTEADLELVIVAELNRGHNDAAAATCAAIRAAVVRDHGVNPRRIVLIPAGTSLKTPSGKIQRAQTRAALIEGRVSIVHESRVVDAPAAPTWTATLATADYDRIVSWFLAKARSTGIDTTALNGTTLLTEVGFDSVKIIELKTDLARDLGIVIDLADLYALTDIQSLADYVLRQQQREHEPDAPAGLAPTGAAQPGAAPLRPPPNALAAQRLRRAAAGRTADGSSHL